MILLYCHQVPGLKCQLKLNWLECIIFIISVLPCSCNACTNIYMDISCLLFVCNCRGFGFVIYKDPTAVDKVLSGGPHQLDSKIVCLHFFTACFHNPFEHIYLCSCSPDMWCILFIYFCSFFNVVYHTLVNKDEYICKYPQQQTVIRESNNGTSSDELWMKLSNHNQLITTKVKRLKPSIALNGKPITELRSITCHMGSQCYLPPDTSERARPLPQLARPVLELPIPRRDGRLSWPR